jgi:hypothetical protein
MDIYTRYSSLRNKLELLDNLKRVEEKKLSDTLSEKDKLLEDIDILEDTQQLLSVLTKLLIDREIKPIQDFVTFGLRKVFVGKDLEFKIEKRETSSGISYDLILRDGLIEDTISDSFGGSVEEVASLMLRLIMLQRLGKVPFLAMDEFFTGVDVKHRSNLIGLLRVLCEKAGFNIFLITHQEDFISGAHTILEAYPTEEGLKIKEVKSDAICQGDYIQEKKV